MKYLFIITLLVTGLIPYASAAQLDASILSEEDSTEPSFQFLRVIYIEYEDNGNFSELLRGEKQTISFEAGSNTPGTDEIIANLNQNLRAISSNAIVTDVKIKYQAILQGNENSAVIEYKVQLIPTITNHVIAKSFEKSTIDANWRGISIDGPLILQTQYGLFDVNNPKSALDVMVPEISEQLKDVAILELPLIDASQILSLPLHEWHSLFDNTAIIPGAVQYNYTGENVITHYSMGECNIEIGLCDDREWIENNIDLDAKYSIRAIESRDDASIALEGYAESTIINEIEVFQIDLRSSIESDAIEFGVIIMYGMAGFAVIGGAIMFVISNRKIKKDKNEGQTGVDPAHLRAYETSDSAGGYKTNRGESYLISNEIEESKMPL